MVKRICCQITWLVFSITSLFGAGAAPELNAAQVTLPYSELKNLLQAAQPQKAEESAKPPLESALLAARYQIALKGDQATGSVEFETQCFTDSWTLIPLLGTEVQIDEIEPAGTQLITNNNHYSLVMNRAGNQKVRIKFGAKLIGAAEGAHFHLPISAAAINTLSIEGIPEKQIVRVEGGTQIAGEKNRATFRLPARTQLDFDLIADKSIGPAIPSRWNLETQSVVQFADGKLNYTAHLTGNTEDGSAVSMELEFPAATGITKITGADLADWQFESSAAEKHFVQIRWQTRGVMRRDLTVEYNASQPLTAGEWKLRAPVVVEGTTVPPVFVVISEPGLELTCTGTSEAPQQLPPWLVDRVNGRNYIVFAGDVPVKARWLPLVETAPAVVESARARMRIVSDGSVLNEAEYAVRHERAVKWKLNLPADSELLKCSVDGRAMNPSDGGQHTIEFLLPASKGVTTVSLSYTAKKSAFKPVSGQFKVELPQTDLLINQLDWELRIPASYEVAAFEGNVEARPGCAGRDGTACTIRLHKELCKNERPQGEFFYQIPEPNK
jgi:hypothetical protein